MSEPAGHDAQLAQVSMLIREIDTCLADLRQSISSLSMASGYGAGVDCADSEGIQRGECQHDLTPLRVPSGVPGAVRVLGRYQLRCEIGQGAMGVVHEGWDTSIGRRVAIKTIRGMTQAPIRAKAIAARFAREAHAIRRLDHPNVVRFFDYGEEAGIAFIAMELLKGQDLRRRLGAGEQFTLQTIVRLMEQLLDALAHAHRHGVIHRDIKPANLFILPDGTLKITDFGIARLDQSGLEHSRSLIGTPRYMSPEQLQGFDVDERSDLYSAGIVFRRLLLGDNPSAHGIPSGFEGFLNKALARRPCDRFQSASDFKLALQHTAGAEPRSTRWRAFAKVALRTR